MSLWVLLPLTVVLVGTASVARAVRRLAAEVERFDITRSSVQALEAPVGGLRDDAGRHGIETASRTAIAADPARLLGPPGRR